MAAPTMVELRLFSCTSSPRMPRLEVHMGIRGLEVHNEQVVNPLRGSNGMKYIASLLLLRIWFELMKRSYNY